MSKFSNFSAFLDPFNGNSPAKPTDCVQDLCRAGPGYPRGALCAGSRLAAKTEFDEIRDRYSLGDSRNLTKLSTPSGHRGRQLHLENMYGNMAEINLIISDTKQARKEWTNTFVPYQPRQSRDLYRVYDW